MLSVLYWQPTGGLMAQANLCGKVRSHGTEWTLTML